MNWTHILQGLNDALSVVLIARLLLLRLQSVYRILCAYLLVQLVGSWIDFLGVITRLHWDYRAIWIPIQLSLWVLSLTMVYAFLKGVLATLPGILRFSRRLLNLTFSLAIGIAVWSAFAEYSRSNAVRFVTPLGRLVGHMLVLERAICSAALLAILAILCFVLWFPVQMPKNLAMFSIGFAVYFAATTASLLTWSLFSARRLDLIDDVIMLTLSLCYAYWTIFLTPEGESIPVRMGHRWQPEEQDRLIGQLDAMNASLLRSARR